MGREIDQAEGTVPFSVLAAAERFGQDEEQQYEGKQDVITETSSGSLLYSRAAMFCYIIGGLGVIAGFLTMFADEYSVPSPFLTGSAIVIVNGFIICSGAAIQYLYEIRNLLKSSRGSGHAQG